MIEAEEVARAARGRDRRVAAAHLGRFKALADFDWTWSSVDRAQVDELATLGFVTGKRNVVLVGPNGVGKTMVAKNLGWQAAAAHIASFERPVGADPDDLPDDRLRALVTGERDPPR